MCTVLLPPSVNPIAVKYIISYILYVRFLFDTATFFGCPHQPSSDREWIHNKSKADRPLLTNRIDIKLV